jgi:gamma-carbonic anhydrase
MLIEHRGKRPTVDPSAYVAPTAVLCGDVRIGPRCVVMENALACGREAHPVELGDDVLVGPHAHVNGSEVGDGCFIATGVSLFPGSRLGRDVEVRINGVVHVNTVLEDEAMVPIGWVAVGNPARTIAPWDHDEIWRIQEALDFPRTVYGLPRSASARERMEKQAGWFAARREDRLVDD